MFGAMVYDLCVSRTLPKSASDLCLAMVEPSMRESIFSLTLEAQNTMLQASPNADTQTLIRTVDGPSLEHFTVVSVIVVFFIIICRDHDHVS